MSAREDLTDEELHYLEERIAILFSDPDKEGMEPHEMLCLAYIQGMVECVIAIVRPDLSDDYEGAKVLMNLAKRAGGLNIDAVDRRDVNPRRN